MKQFEIIKQQLQVQKTEVVARFKLIERSGALKMFQIKINNSLFRSGKQ